MWLRLRVRDQLTLRLPHPLCSQASRCAQGHAHTCACVCMCVRALGLSSWALATSPGWGLPLAEPPVGGEDGGSLAGLGLSHPLTSGVPPGPGPARSAAPAVAAEAGTHLRVWSKPTAREAGGPSSSSSS